MLRGAHDPRLRRAVDVGGARGASWALTDTLVVCGLVRWLGQCSPASRLLTVRCALPPDSAADYRRRTPARPRSVPCRLLRPPDSGRPPAAGRSRRLARSCPGLRAAHKMRSQLPDKVDTEQDAGRRGTAVDPVRSGVRLRVLPGRSRTTAARRGRALPLMVPSPGPPKLPLRVCSSCRVRSRQSPRVLPTRPGDHGASYASG